MMTHAIALAAIVCARTVTLDQAEQAAETQAPTVREARADAAAGQARTEVARAPALPQVKIEGIYERTTGNRRQRPGRTTFVDNSWTTYNWYEVGGTASQLVWDFGLTLNRWRAAEARAVALNDTARAALLEALSTVRTAYFNARAAKELIVVAKTTLANQERHLVQITGFVAAGTRPDIDLAQARAGRANARVAVIRAETGYEVARAELNRAMGQAGDTDYDVAEQTLPAVPGETGPVGPLIDDAIKARPDLAALDAEVRASQERRRVVAAANATGAVTAWDHATPDDAAARYIRTGRDFWSTLERARLPLE